MKNVDEFINLIKSDENVPYNLEVVNYKVLEVKNKIEQKNNQEKQKKNTEEKVNPYQMQFQMINNNNNNNSLNTWVSSWYGLIITINKIINIMSKPFAWRILLII